MPEPVGLIRPGVRCRNLASQVLGQGWRVCQRTKPAVVARGWWRPSVGPALVDGGFKAANFVW